MKGVVFAQQGPHAGPLYSKCVLCYFVMSAVVKVPFCETQWLSLASGPSSHGKSISFEIEDRPWADMTSNTSMSGRHVGVDGQTDKMKVKRDSRIQLGGYDFKYKK